MTVVEDAKGRRARIGELALVFLRMGVTAFGGPPAHVALMENELVRRRRWLSHERFLDLLGAANLIPGPSSSELAIYIGFERAGWIGLVVAGACFILPAALMVGVIAAAYVRFGSLPQVGGVLYGIKPVVIAVVVQALGARAEGGQVAAAGDRGVGLLRRVGVRSERSGGAPRRGPPGPRAGGA